MSYLFDTNIVIYYFNGLTADDALSVWYADNAADTPAFETQMRRKVHYVIHPDYLWNSIHERARTQDPELLQTLERAFQYIENQSFESRFQGLFSEINLNSEKLGRTPVDRNRKLCTIIAKIGDGIAQFATARDILGDAYEYLIGNLLTSRRRRLRQEGRRVLHPTDRLDHPLAHRQPRQPRPRHRQEEAPQLRARLHLRLRLLAAPGAPASETLGIINQLIRLSAGKGRPAKRP